MIFITKVRDMRGILVGFVTIFAMLNLLPCCAYSVHQLYASSMDPNVTPKNGKWVQAESTNFVILFFTFDSDYVERGVQKLKDACPERLAFVTTEHVTSFKLLSYEQKIVLKGLCVKNST